MKQASHSETIVIVRYEPASIEEDETGRKVVAAAFKAHTNPGPGLLESV